MLQKKKNFFGEENNNTLKIIRRIKEETEELQQIKEYISIKIINVKESPYSHPYFEDNHNFFEDSGNLKNVLKRNDEYSYMLSEEIMQKPRPFDKHTLIEWGSIIKTFEATFFKCKTNKQKEWKITDFEKKKKRKLIEKKEEVFFKAKKTNVIVEEEEEGGEEAKEREEEKYWKRKLINAKSLNKISDIINDNMPDKFTRIKKEIEEKDTDHLNNIWEKINTDIIKNGLENEERFSKINYVIDQIKNEVDAIKDITVILNDETTQTDNKDMLTIEEFIKNDIFELLKNKKEDTKDVNTILKLIIDIREEECDIINNEKESHENEEVIKNKIEENNNTLNDFNDLLESYNEMLSNEEFDQNEKEDYIIQAKKYKFNIDKITTENKKLMNKLNEIEKNIKTIEKKTNRILNNFNLLKSFYKTNFEYQL